MPCFEAKLPFYIAYLSFGVYLTLNELLKSTYTTTGDRVSPLNYAKRLYNFVYDFDRYCLTLALGFVIAISLLISRFTSASIQTKNYILYITIVLTIFFIITLPTTAARLLITFGFLFSVFFCVSFLSLLIAIIVDAYYMELPEAPSARISGLNIKFGKPTFCLKLLYALYKLELIPLSIEQSSLQIGSRAYICTTTYTFNLFGWKLLVVSLASPVSVSRARLGAKLKHVRRVLYSAAKLG